MSLHDRVYTNHLRFILANGEHRGDRTGNGTISYFGKLDTYDLERGFPLLTTKEIGFKSVLRELLWFISGDTNIGALVAQKCNIWNDDAYRFYSETICGSEAISKWSPGVMPELTKEQFLDRIKSGRDEEDYTRFSFDDGYSVRHYRLGDLGPVYGHQWTKYLDLSGPSEVTNQLDYVVDQVRNNPLSRRILLNAWNASDMLDKYTALPCCHLGFQLYVDGVHLDMMFTMRSNDVFLGCPYNIASYAALLHAIAHITGKTPRYMKQVTGDAHIYNGHLEAVNEQLERDLDIPAPTLTIRDRGQQRLSDFCEEDFILEGYNPLPSIKAPLFT